MPRPLPLVFTRADALEAGYSIGQINRLIANGTWVRLRGAAYAESAVRRTPQARTRRASGCAIDP
jgi:hypothetical protein